MRAVRLPTQPRRGPRPVLSQVSHPRAVLTGVPRWALADIFVSYTSSDMAATLWIRSGAHTARNAHLRSWVPSRHQSDTPNSPRCYLRRGDVSNRRSADTADGGRGCRGGADRGLSNIVRLLPPFEIVSTTPENGCSSLRRRSAERNLHRPSAAWT
jgi:hypothetical protein